MGKLADKISELGYDVCVKMMDDIDHNFSTVTKDGIVVSDHSGSFSQYCELCRIAYKDKSVHFKAENMGQIVNVCIAEFLGK